LGRFGSHSRQFTKFFDKVFNWSYEFTHISRVQVPGIWRWILGVKGQMVFQAFTLHDLPAALTKFSETSSRLKEST
jgi:hypothetical protein